MSAAKQASKQRKLVASDNQLRRLSEVNSTVQEIRNSEDLLERIIFDQDGTDLRALVGRIGQLVQKIAKEHALFGDRQQRILEKSSSSAVAAVTPSSFAKRNLSIEYRQVLDNMFADALDRNANDDKARMLQLRIVFAALTNLIDVRQQCMERIEPVDRFAPPETSKAPKTVAERKAAAVSKANAAKSRKRAQANLIPAKPLRLFFANNALDLLTRHLDGKLDVKGYVEECINWYLKYKEAVTPDIVREHKRRREQTK